MTEPRWGLTYPLDNVALGDQRRLVEALPDLGFTDLWSKERGGLDAFTPLALASAWAPSLRLGTAVVSVYTRGPALLAMQAAGLADAAPGRFALGIGASSPVIVERWNGIPFDRPYLRCRDTLRFLRAALAGEQVTEEYETFRIARFRLERPPVPPPPILLAALRPGMLRLAAREADGVILNWLAPEDVPTVLAEFDAPDKEVVARVFVCPTTDTAHARAVGRRLIAGYLTVPAYAEYQRWLGRGDALKAMWDAWAAGDRRQAADLIPDEVIDDLIVHGDPAQCRARLARFADPTPTGTRGVTTIAPTLLPTPEMTGPGRSVDPAAALAAVTTIAPAAGT